jgi:hypothetical protein
MRLAVDPAREAADHDGTGVGDAACEHSGDGPPVPGAGSRPDDRHSRLCEKCRLGVAAQPEARGRVGNPRQQRRIGRFASTDATDRHGLESSVGDR